LPTTSTKPSASRARAVSEIVSGENARAVINQIAQKAGSEANRKLAELPPDQAKAITGVFSRMKNLYGHLWSSNFKTEDQATLAKIDWLRAFRQIGAQQGEVNRALDWCAEHQADMPNLPRFIQIIKYQREEDQRAARRESERAAIQAQLEEPPEHRKAREKAEAEAQQRRHAESLEHIARIKAMLSGAPEETG
jgi:hypothetical protein